MVDHIACDIKIRDLEAEVARLQFQLKHFMELKGRIRLELDGDLHKYQNAELSIGVILERIALVLDSETGGLKAEVARLNEIKAAYRHQQELDEKEAAYQLEQIAKLQLDLKISAAGATEAANQVLDLTAQRDGLTKQVQELVGALEEIAKFETDGQTFPIQASPEAEIAKAVLEKIKHDRPT